MGADIHGYLEYRQKDDKNKDDPFWRSFCTKLILNRNYGMFGYLTNGKVRYDDALIDLFDPKGLPQNVGWLTSTDVRVWVTDDGKEENSCTVESALKWNKNYGCKLEYAHDDPTQVVAVDNPDWHTYSWLTLDEYKLVIKTIQKHAKKKDTDLWIGVDYIALLDTMKSLEKNGMVTRFVFWFDN